MRWEGWAGRCAATPAACNGRAAAYPLCRRLHVGGDDVCTTPAQHCLASVCTPAAGTVNTKMLSAGWGSIGIAVKVRGCALGGLRSQVTIGIAGCRCPPTTHVVPSHWELVPCHPLPTAGCQLRAEGRHRPRPGLHQRGVLCWGAPRTPAQHRARQGGAAAAVAPAGGADGGAVERVKQQTCHDTRCAKCHIILGLRLVAILGRCVRL